MSSWFSVKPPVSSLLVLSLNCLAGTGQENLQHFVHISISGAFYTREPETELHLSVSRRRRDGADPRLSTSSWITTRPSLVRHPPLTPFVPVCHSMMEYDSENLNSEEIYSSLRGVTEAIQSYSFRSQDDLMELRRDGKRDAMVRRNSGAPLFPCHLALTAFTVPSVGSRSVLGCRRGGLRSYGSGQQNLTAEHAFAALLRWATLPRLQPIQLHRHAGQDRRQRAGLRRRRGAPARW